MISHVRVFRPWDPMRRVKTENGDLLREGLPYLGPNEMCKDGKYLVCELLTNDLFPYRGKRSE